MVETKRLVLDILKPHEPGLLEFSEVIARCEGVSGANVVLLETDREVQNVKVTVEGDDIDSSAVEEEIDGLGGTVHSFDEVACGEVLVEESETPQDVR
ncbi:DUF211 domain-containing protein [Halomicrococcus sp. SG-WS-1]|uniref:DUF211 domain-containing protein n=1 Tax=Halomicrococcus sp. SG-WS-1 TaxID=3439057 RepID=UPI003F78E7EA